MDIDRIKRRQSLKIIISESIMVLIVALTVIILAFVVSGYWFNADFQLERQGLLQVYSVPTGASVEIDGESSWLQRTNTSKVLSSGKHTVTLSKEGYDTWSKTINISEGLLYRLHYPRLFLNNRAVEKALDVGGVVAATVSPDRTRLLLIDDIQKWSLVNLEDEKIQPKELNVSEYFAGVGTDIISMDWARDSVHILLKVSSGDKYEWILLDTRNIENSINLTKEFSMDFEYVKILDNSANNLLVLKNDNIHKIDVSGKQISSGILEGAVSFDHYETELVFLSRVGETYRLGLAKLNDGKVTDLMDSSVTAKVTISKFYDDWYITVLDERKVSLYRKDNFEFVAEFNLEFAPEQVEVGHDGKFIVMYTGREIATLDMEAMTVVTWSVDGEKFGWLDNDMIYSVRNNELFVYDFDGLNRRLLAREASGDLPVAITNNKWLYYFSNGSLIREWLIPR